MPALSAPTVVAIRFAPDRPRAYDTAKQYEAGCSAMSGHGLEAVFLESRPALLRFLSARGAGADAEDMLQELWTKASAEPSGPIASPLAYLYRMADNLMLDRRREAQRRMRRDDAWNDSTAATLPGAADQPSADRILLAREKLRLVDARLDALGDRTAAIFRSHRIDGVSQREIAQQIGISVSAIEKHLQKAYRLLAELRAEDGADSPGSRRLASEGIDDVTG